MADDEKLLESVAERLRFFYSDANIRMDKFLRRELLEKTENGGFVPIGTLLKFKTIQKLTTDVKVVARAAKHESVRDRVKLNDGETGIGRQVPFDMKKMSDNVKLSLRVDNIPITEEKEGEKVKKTYAVGIDEIRDLFAPYGTVALVKLQFYRSAWRKESGGESAGQSREYPAPIGAAFVEFETEEELGKAAADLCADGQDKPATTLELGGNELKIQTMKKWLEKKEAGRGEDWKGKSPKKRAREEDEGNGKGSRKSDEQSVEKESVKYEEFKLDWKKGHAISIKGLKDDCDREAILDTLGKYLGYSGDHKTMGVYVDYSRGQPEGALRFKSDNFAGIEPDQIVDKVAEIAAKLNDGSITIGGSKVAAVVLEGEEEEKYYKNFIDFKNKQIKHRAEERNSRKRARRGGRGGR